MIITHAMLITAVILMDVIPPPRTATMKTPVLTTIVIPKTEPVFTLLFVVMMTMPAQQTVVMKILVHVSTLILHVMTTMLAHLIHVTSALVVYTMS
jgi:hypothetical protein